MPGSQVLTDREFWIEYWNQTPDATIDDSWFIGAISKLPSDGATLVELGGFPGHMAAWFHKRGFQTTILDFVILDDRLRRTERLNGLPAGAIRSIECDLMGELPGDRFDVVASFGLAEHFADLPAIVARHAALAKPGGTILITMPNFRGINGMFQRIFDPANYFKHNIHSMDPVVLRRAIEPVAESADILYFGRPRFWIENSEARPRWFRSLVRVAGRAMCLLGWRGRIFSPHIAAIARLPR